MDKSVAKKAEVLLETQPYLLKAMEEGYANLSEIARKLNAELGRNGERASFEAVRGAIKRLADKRRRHAEISESRIKRILRKSKLELSTKICLLIILPEAFEVLRPKLPESVAFVRSKSGATVVVSEEMLPSIKKHVHRNDIMIENEGLVALSLIAAENLQDIPGVFAFLTGKLAENGINIKEFLSSYRDMIMIFDKRDSLKAYQLLERLIS